MKNISVFLSHNSADKPSVESIALKLRQEVDIKPWLDKWNLIPGDPWQEALEDALEESQICVVFIGPSGIGPWQNEEMRDAIDRRVATAKGTYRVVPVLLPGASREERGRLPRFLTRSTWVDFSQSLDNADAFHRLLCGIRGIPPGPQNGNTNNTTECPYRGLSYFDVEHASYFFGREALTEWLVNELKIASPNPNRFLAIVGASGSGKSSLARAGLLYALQIGKIPNSQNWQQVIFFPGDNPLENLAIALATNGIMENNAGAIEDFISRAIANPRHLHLTVKLFSSQHLQQEQIILLADQFEEIFTSCKDDTIRNAFVENLVYASSIAKGHLILILTMRSDFYGKCAAYESLSALISDHNLLVGAMNEEEIRNTIVLPAAKSGCTFEAGLVDTLVTDALQLSALPLLQDTLRTLWLERNDNTLSYAEYRTIGGLGGALNQRADTLYESLTAEDQEICKALFLRMTQPGEGTEDTRRRVKLQEILNANDENDPTKIIIQNLSNPAHRLVTTSGDIENITNAYVEVAHEALFRNWKKLQSWIDEDRAALRTHRKITEAAEEWNNKKKDESYLFRGARLAEMEEWAATTQITLNTLEQSFFDTSFSVMDREATEKENQRKAELDKAKKNTRIAITISTIAILFAIAAWWQFQESQSRFSRYLYSEAEKAFNEDDTRLCLLLNQEALEFDRNNHAADSLNKLLVEEYIGVVFKNSYNYRIDNPYLLVETDYNEEKKTVNLIVYNLEIGSIIQQFPNTYSDIYGENDSYSYSADSNYLLVQTDFNEEKNTVTLIVYNLEMDSIIQQFPNNYSDSDSYSYSDDNKYLSVLTDYNQEKKTANLIVYNLEMDSIIQQFPSTYGDSDGFSADSKYLSVETDYNQLKKTANLIVYNLEIDSIIQQFPNTYSDSYSDSYHYSADSKYLSVKTNYNQEKNTVNLIVYNLEMDSIIQQFPNNYSYSFSDSYSYSADNKYLSVLISDEKNKYIKILEMGKQKEIRIIRHQNDISVSGFSRKGNYLISYSNYKGSEDNGSLKVINLDIPQEKLLEHYLKIYPPLTPKERKEYGL